MEKISNDAGIKLVFDMISTLEKDGFCITKNNFNKVDFKNIGKDIGHFYLEDKYLYNLCFNSKLLFNYKLNFLKCAIFHELAHTIQYNESFNAKIIEFDKDKNEIYANTNKILYAGNTIFNNNGHTKLWQQIVNEINIKHKLNPAVHAYLSDADIDLFLKETIMPNNKYRISAKHIDTTINGLTLDDIDKYSKIKPTLQTTEMSVEQVNEENTTISHSYRNMEQYKED